LCFGAVLFGGGDGVADQLVNLIGQAPWLLDHVNIEAGKILDTNFPNEFGNLAKPIIVRSVRMYLKQQQSNQRSLTIIINIFLLSKPLKN
jgi:hypothetical protein